MSKHDPVIVAYARTPHGTFGGALSKFSAPELGAMAVNHCFVKNSKLSKQEVKECIFGSVLQANLGQAPARQVAIKSGLPLSTCCTTINKVCASGMKSIMLGAQSILLHNLQEDFFDGLIVVGGMESMSNVPYYSPDTRFGKRMGPSTMIDGMVKDGLTDVYNQIHMGSCAELCAKQFQISRKEQDDYSVQSFIHAQKATPILQKFEIVPIMNTQQPNKILLDKDESLSKFDETKIRNLPTVFDKSKQATITAGNASSIADGASCMILCSRGYAQKHQIPILATIKGYADAEREPTEFTIAPPLAVEKLLNQTKLSKESIDLFEINEAFAVVPLSNMKLLHIPLEKVNIYGSSIAIGHPLGSSGCRIVCTLLTQLLHEKKKRGIASLCNGGGGASAICIEVDSPFSMETVSSKL